MIPVMFSKEQRELITKLTVYLLLLFVTVSFAIYINNTVEDYNKKSAWLKNDINELNRKLDGLNRKTLEFSEAIKTWENLSEEDKTLRGLRINDAKDLLDKLQAQYKLSVMKISFSKPEEISGDYKTDTVSIVSSTISMNFNALSDEMVYNFLGDLVGKFPGYIQIKSFSINKPAAITKEILKKISLGEEASIIPVSIEFYWHDLKYKGATQAPTSTGAEVETNK